MAVIIIFIQEMVALQLTTVGNQRNEDIRHRVRNNVKYPLEGCFSWLDWDSNVSLGGLKIDPQIYLQNLVFLLLATKTLCGDKDKWTKHHRQAA